AGICGAVSSFALDYRTMAYLLKNGQAVLERNGKLTVSREDVLIRGSKIAAVGSPAVPETADEDVQVIDATDKLILPGLIDSHTHPLTALLRLLVGPAPFDVWLVRRLGLGRVRLTPRDCYISCLLDSIEKIKSGTTASVGHTFAGLFP